jgi:hypothetical protein
MKKVGILTYKPYCQKGIFANYKTPMGGLEPYYMGVYDFLTSMHIIQEKPDGQNRFNYMIDKKILNLNKEHFEAFFKINKDHKYLKHIYECFPIDYGKLLAFLKNVCMMKTAPPPQQLVQNQMAQQNQIALQNRMMLPPRRQGGSRKKRGNKPRSRRRKRRLLR